ncbi:MAG: GH32 C-terminal domain-containing protein [Haloglomus sp.]
MADDEPRVGFLHDGPLTTEQQAARAWLDERTDAAAVGLSDLAASGSSDSFATDHDAFDVLWWHRDAPLDDGALAAARDAIVAFLESGGGLLLTLRAMSAVTALGIESVAPDAVGTESVAEPTGVLWRRLYDDHPAVADLDGLRHPVCDRGAVPTAHYESVVPASGEVLAGAVRGEQDVPDRMTVAAWNHGPGGVIGVGAPLAFHEPAADWVSEARSALAAGCLSALADGDRQPARPKDAAAFRAMRDRFADDHHRPGYHFTPPANWLNDPNGLIRWNGRYHVFYQYNPAGPFHNTIHWGHAVSDDLLHWADEPVALSPSPDGPDRDGCWSGCAVTKDGRATVLYTGGNGRWQLPCLATSEDPNLCSWSKHEGNPVIEAPPDDLDLLTTEHWAAEFRDHSIWRDGGTWYQIIGSGVTDGGGAALLYTSDDLKDWAYEGPLLLGDEGHGTVWECPEVLDFGDRQLLHVSNYEEVVYYLGAVRDGEFTVDHRGLLDHGDFYAPQSLADGARYVTWGWLPETREVGDQWNAGWSGALSLPRVLEVGPDGRLRQRPAAEVTGLRERELAATVPGTLASDERHRLDASGRALEIDLTVALDDAEAFELSVLESPAREERTVVRYTREGELLVDRGAASAANEGAADTQRMAVPPHDEPLELRAFVDGSVVELYANERHCLTTRVYPSRTDSTGVSVAAEGGRATLPSFAVWELEDDVARSDVVTSACGTPE